MKIRQFVVMPLIALFILLRMSALAADKDEWGVWTDAKKQQKGQVNQDIPVIVYEHTYAFLRNHEINFYWKGHRRYSESAKSYDETETGAPIYYFPKVEGVWKKGNRICELGTARGNLMIYVDQLQCCIFAEFLGNKLVLSKIGSQGRDEYGICENRVLTRTKKMPPLWIDQ